eukprot:6179001-Pleurochrysis_carterae.AAC.1
MEKPKPTINAGAHHNSGKRTSPLSVKKYFRASRAQLFGVGHPVGPMKALSCETMHITYIVETDCGSAP